MRPSKHHTITISTQGDAFQHVPDLEVARILRELADHFEDFGTPSSVIIDSHGDFCGEVRTVEHPS